MKIGIHWFRCDLRLADNSALHAACAEMDAVIPIFIFDPAILKAPETGAPQVAYMLRTLEALRADVQAAGGQLIFRHGKVIEEMRTVLKETGARFLFLNRDYEPYARERDDAVEKMARSLEVEVSSFKDGMIQEPHEVLKSDGKPYGVFTAYSRVWRTRAIAPVLPVVKFHRPVKLKKPRSLPLPTLKELGFSTDLQLPDAGERIGRDVLKRFVAGGLHHYKKQRDFPAEKGTSQLSPHLRMGTISPRTVVAWVEKEAARRPKARADIDTFIGEIIWRDFYKQILWHHPHVATSCFKPQYNDLKWENNQRLFAAWCEGRTGYPIVDAGMRQLNSTGWMHNRVRMVVAAFLTKDLLVSWQWGERYFMQKLFDADLAANNGGWQWSASTGTDAQPYFRIFNPTSQAKKFDPEGVYIHRHVPEVETRAYPVPIVDHARQRVKALELFRKVRVAGKK
jgi:deoxyribodipyrimidine photo-lyase